MAGLSGTLEKIKTGSQVGKSSRRGRASPARSSDRAVHKKKPPEESRTTGLGVSRAREVIYAITMGGGSAPLRRTVCKPSGGVRHFVFNQSLPKTTNTTRTIRMTPMIPTPP